jgi:hypothetical protein
MGEWMRCPCCGHVSTVKVDEIEAIDGVATLDTQEYFICQNPKCSVERIYADNGVMVGGEL